MYGVRMAVPFTFLVRYSMKLNRTLYVFKFDYTWSIYTFYATANTGLFVLSEVVCLVRT
jgi:hypothetical protein